MTGDHHGQTAVRATLLVRAADEILGTHRPCGSQVHVSVAASPVRHKGDPTYLNAAL
jgi:hypothetical protein